MSLEFITMSSMHNNRNTVTHTHYCTLYKHCEMLWLTHTQKEKDVFPQCFAKPPSLSQPVSNTQTRHNNTFYLFMKFFRI